MRLAAFCSLLGISWCSVLFGAQPAKYQLDVELLPDSGEIHVTGQVTLQPGHPSRRDLVFGLHRTFSISSLAVNDEPAEFVYIEPDSPQSAAVSKQVSARLPPGVSGTPLILSISYEGKLQDFPEFGAVEGGEVYLDDEISRQRIELSLYSSWYPSFGFGARFDSELAVSSLPGDWRIACIGQEHVVTPTGTRCQGRAVDDLVIVASPEFTVERVDTPGGTFIVYHTRLPETYVANESLMAGRALAFFTEVLDPPSSTKSAIKHVYSPRKFGQGGYARVGLTVFSEGRVLESLERNPLASHLKGSAHESAHFWWNFGSAQGDWMNEAFAEYFSLLAVREIKGEERFDSEMVRCLQAVSALPEDAPALSEVPFSNDGNGFTIRYLKGALMLDHLRYLLGDERFFRVSHDFHQKFKNSKVGTDAFARFWKSALGEELEWIDIWLDSKGGLPDGASFSPGSGNIRWQ